MRRVVLTLEMTAIFFIIVTTINPLRQVGKPYMRFTHADLFSAIPV